MNEIGVLTLTILALARFFVPFGLLLIIGTLVERRKPLSL